MSYTNHISLKYTFRQCDLHFKRKKMDEALERLRSLDLKSSPRRANVVVEALNKKFMDNLDIINEEAYS